MNVLSLFDGMSGAMGALQSLGIKPTNYFASEIDKYAEAVSKYHYPDIIRLGDVTKVSSRGLPKIDLLVAGFPCQSFSLAGKQLNFDDPRGKLFFEVVRLIHELQPKYFLLENVRMKKEIQDEISRLVGVQPIQINSSLLSAQNRVRNYWTNIPGITQPEDRGLILADIIESGYVDREKAYCLDANYSKGTSVADYLTKKKRQLVFIESKKVINVNPSGRGMNGNVYDVSGKSPTLTTNKGEGIKITGAALRGRYLSGDGKRSDSTVGSQAGLTTQQLELRTDLKSNCLSTVQKDSLVAIYQKPRGYNKGGFFTEKSPTLSSHSWEQNNHLCISEKKIAIDDINYRKLTPLECERLQTLPDDFTKWGIINGKIAQISNSQRYKMIGNGFTCAVIAHIISPLA